MSTKKIIVAVDSFKGGNSSVSICSFIEDGVKRVLPNAQIVKIPMADGGEGTVEAFLCAAGGRIVRCKAMDALGREADSLYGILEDGTAIIEMAAASGLPQLAPEEKNAWNATTYGTGQLILDALEKGCKKIILSLGGSATNDGGAGMAQALGARLLDKDFEEIGFGGGELLKLEHINLSGFDQRIAATEFICACDVTNPLCGENGASAVFGPQKGADIKQVLLLDQALSHYAQVISKELGKNIAQIPGSGAAGGLGGGCIAFLNAVLKSGIDIMLDTVEFEKRLNGADFVITGEGKIDGQSAAGKVPVGIARRTKAFGKIPVFAIVGAIGENAEQCYQLGIDSILSTADKDMTLEYAISNQKRLITDTAERLTRIIAAVC